MPKVPKMSKMPKIKDVNHFIKKKFPISGYFNTNLAGFTPMACKPAGWKVFSTAST
jgi:hypothetical protein